MKKFLLFVFTGLICASGVHAAVRGENTVLRTKTNPQTTTTSVKQSRSVTSRSPIKTTISARTTKPVSVLMPKTQPARIATRTTTQNSSQNRTVTARAAATTVIASETRTGTEYEQCKSAFFTCMDQFCQLKNDNYRRCSCSNRIFGFQDTAETYQKIGEQLTEFTENLDVIGMSKEQATAMKTASAGEDALTEDKSTSKQLLQAIMNSIKGTDSSVGGKYKDLNSINISADISNAFNTDDSGQIIASYNGTTLYKAVYPKCRNAVKDDCNNASLQRAINAYLMAIEQDCNTVETALKSQQKTLKNSTHESSAMLDLARVENRQKHNSDDVATCLTNIEQAIQSEQVCGAGYHKCLDNGQFIDITTGAPLTGVADFYKLGQLLTFKSGTKLVDQKLSSIQNNRPFVQQFESKTKQFAKDALSRCSEDADFVWQQYLDRAMLDIYYAQQDKVKKVKQSCMDLVTQCYNNQNTAVAQAIANLTGDSSILLKPTTLSLTQQMCDDYIESCNGMFGANAIKQYIKTKDDTDIVNACRAAAQQCFDNFGGTGYNSLYYTQSGLFEPGKAIDWFSLYSYYETPDGIIVQNKNMGQPIIVSPCAQQLADIDGCPSELMEEIFGGFNKYTLSNGDVVYSAASESPAKDETRKIRPSGIATEVYNTIINNLTTRCTMLGGHFVEYKYATLYGYKPDDFCKINSSDYRSVFYIDSTNNSENTLVYWYHFIPEEDMCPSNYNNEVDTQSWGMCSCWENGGYRSKNGTTETCRPILPAISGNGDTDPVCSVNLLCKDNDNDNDNNTFCKQPRYADSVSYWCQQSVTSSLGQLCPTLQVVRDGANMFCGKTDAETDAETDAKITTVHENVPHHNALDE